MEETSLLSLPEGMRAADDERQGHRRRVSPGPDEGVGRVDRRHLDGDEHVRRARNRHRQFADLYRFRGPRFGDKRGTHRGVDRNSLSAAKAG
jgi:hypothetical protein